MFLLLGVLQDDQLHYSNIHTKRLGQFHAGSLVVSSVSMSPS